MNKNSYYYRKLAQSIIFSDEHWRKIVDFDDPHDNVYSEEFLCSLYHLLLRYQRKSCLETVDINQLQQFLSDVRFTYPYSSRTEKEEIYAIVNEMIRMSNRMDDSGIGKFYMEEYKKRYGTYARTPLGKDLLARYFAYCLDEEPRGIKKDLAYDIYSLTLLHYDIADLSQEHIDNFSLTDCYLSTLNALLEENKGLLMDPIIRNRFLYILRRNKSLLSEKREEISTGNKNDDKMFERHNQFVLRRLERFQMLDK